MRGIVSEQVLESGGGTSGHGARGIERQAFQSRPLLESFQELATFAGADMNRAYPPFPEELGTYLARFAPNGLVAVFGTCAAQLACCLAPHVRRTFVCVPEHDRRNLAREGAQAEKSEERMECVFASTPEAFARALASKRGERPSLAIAGGCFSRTMLVAAAQAVISHQGFVGSVSLEMPVVGNDSVEKAHFAELIERTISEASNYWGEAIVDEVAVNQRGIYPLLQRASDIHTPRDVEARATWDVRQLHDYVLRLPRVAFAGVARLRELRQSDFLSAAGEYFSGALIPLPGVKADWERAIGEESASDCRRMPVRFPLTINLESRG